MTVRLANAPVTWGVWGANSLPADRTPADILRAVSSAGYDGIELGPLGLFGSAGEVRQTLGEYGLTLAGAYVPIRVFEGEDAVASDIAQLREVCAALVSCGGDGPIILAEETIDAIKRNVARGAAHPELDLTDGEWRLFADTMARAADIVRGEGLRVSYHPHTGTHVEQPHEVDRFLELSDVGLTLDTGHARAGGDDPIDLLRRWSARVDHVHLKDLSLAVVDQARDNGSEFSMAEASTPLGHGDLDLLGFLRELAAQRYSGWIVVEQDRRPDGGHDHAVVDQEQHHNLEWLRTHAQGLNP